MASSKTPKAENADNDGLVSVELTLAGGVDVLGDGPKPLLRYGTPGEFTPAEAAALVALVNPHGTPICRIVEGVS